MDGNIIAIITSLLALAGVAYSTVQSRRSKLEELRYPTELETIKELRTKVAGLEAAQVQTLSPEWRKDHHRRYIYVNDSMAKILFSVGITRELMINKTDADIFGDKYAEFVDALEKLQILAQRSGGTAAMSGIPFPGTGRMYTAVKEINTSLGEPIYIGRAYNDHIFTRSA